MKPTIRTLLDRAHATLTETFGMSATFEGVGTVSALIDRPGAGAGSNASFFPDEGITFAISVRKADWTFGALPQPGTIVSLSEFPERRFELTNSGTTDTTTDYLFELAQTSRSTT